MLFLIILGNSKNKYKPKLLYNFVFMIAKIWDIWCNSVDWINWPDCRLVYSDCPISSLIDLNMIRTRNTIFASIYSGDEYRKAIELFKQEYDFCNFKSNFYYDNKETRDSLEYFASFLVETKLSIVFNGFLRLEGLI